MFKLFRLLLLLLLLLLLFIYYLLLLLLLFKVFQIGNRAELAVFMCLCYRTHLLIAFRLDCNP